MRKLFITNDDLKYAFKHNKKGLFHYCDGSKPVNRFKIPDIQQLGFATADIDHVGHIVKGNTYIAQRYVSDTLLINQHKFGIRMFIVILSLNPYIVLYSDGYLSINAEIYDAENINKLNVLSNREISAKAAKLIDDEEEEWNWSYQQFGEYLESKDEIDFDIDHVRNELVNAANLTFHRIMKQNGKFSKSTKKQLKKYLKKALAKKLIDKKDNSYVWLAIDFLLTMEGQVKLLEINLHPGTRYLDDCSWTNVNASGYNDWQCQQGRNITKEIVDVSFEIAFRKSNNISLDKQMLENNLNYHKILIYQDF